MYDSAKIATVLVITDDVALLSSLLESNTTALNIISRESMQAALEDVELLANNNIVIIDIDSVRGATAGVIEQAINLKKSDPTQVLMLVGNSEALGDILRSNIQPIIYRAFNKPIHPNQIFLSFTSACKLHESLVRKRAAGEDLLAIGPFENRTNVHTITTSNKNNPGIYAGVGVLALGLAAWLLIGNNSDSQNPTEHQITVPSPATLDNQLLSTNTEIARVNDLNQDAAKALLEGRQISPAGDNALYYYDQVLAIDPYDLTAYEGKKTLAADLKASYPSLVNNAAFDTALDTITALQSIEPLDTTNYKLRESLEIAISEHVRNLKNTGTQEEINQTVAALDKIGSQSNSSKTAADALKNEIVLLENIDLALRRNILIPPQSGNAYAIVSEALQKNTISKVNFAPRISALSEKLVASAEQAIAEDNLGEAEKAHGICKAFRC